MSVLIKNMTKPNDCFDCIFSDEESRCMFGCDMFGRDDCPLIEVPTPHGRLIDADEIIRIWGGATIEEVLNLSLMQDVP